MAVTVEASGTQAATVGTEHSLHTNAGAKTFVLAVNTTNMVAGDELELRVKTKLLSGSTIAVAWYMAYVGPQSDPIKYSPPLPATGQTSGTEWTLKQTAGTGRSFEWAVLSVG